jgi:hypothetical protein
MTPEDRSFTNRVFTVVVAFIVSFTMMAVVGGFIIARLMNIPVDVDKFYSFLNSPFLVLVGVIVMRLGEKPSDKKDPPAT